MRALKPWKPQKTLGEQLGPCVIQPPIEYYKWEVRECQQVFVLMQAGETIPYTRHYSFESILAFCHENLIAIADVIGCDPDFLRQYQVKKKRKSPCLQ